MIARHKFRFGVKGNPLKSFFGPRKIREHRNFPRRGCENTWEYIGEYFRKNIFFKESFYGGESNSTRA